MFPKKGKLVRFRHMGFTLIELLVVIAIIGILAAIVLYSLNSARSKSRDGKRLADVRQIMTALDLYYTDNGGYPDASGGQPSGGNWLNFLAIYPEYPLPSGLNCGATSYVYEPVNNNTDYALVFCLENVTNGLSTGTHTATESGI